MLVHMAGAGAGDAGIGRPFLFYEPLRKFPGVLRVGVRRKGLYFFDVFFNCRELGAVVVVDERCDLVELFGRVL